MEVKARKIVIKPVKRAKFSGHSSLPGAGIGFEGAQIGKDGYKTGLTREEEATLCEELGLPKGTLSKNINNPYQPNDYFWGSILNTRFSREKDTEFVVDSLMDELKLKVLLLRNDFAANELELAKKPHAEFYIDDVEAKAKVEEVIINYKMDAFDAMRTLALEDKKGYLKIYGKRGLNDVSEAFVQSALFKEVDSNPKKFLELYNNPDIKIMMEIEDFMESGHLQKRGNFYVFQNETLGNSVESVISYFKDIRNQGTKIAVTQAINKTKKEK